jgi:hypothetical protein
VAVIVGVDRASGGGSASTDLLTRISLWFTLLNDDMGAANAAKTVFCENNDIKT